jgi:transposase
MKTAAKEIINPFDIIEEQRCSIEAKDHQIRLLEEKVNYLLHHRFGRKSEQANDLQRTLFGEDDKSTSDTIIEVLVDVPSHKRKRGGRRKPPKHLPRIRIEHDLPEDQKQCSCGACLKQFGEEISEQYDVLPPKFQVLEHVRFKYSCPECNQPPKLAQQNPPAPLPRTQASPGMLAWVGTSKFVDGLPLNRIANLMEKRFDIPFTSTTLADWMIKGAEQIITPLVDAMERALSHHDYMHIDETTLQVLAEQNREASQKSYIWCRVTHGTAPIVLMHYSPSRAGAVASQLLEGFSGYMQTDGYAGYDAAASRPDIVQLGCWAHVRRKFDAASKASSPGAAHIARQGLKQIRNLYHLDNKGKAKPPDERKEYRQQVIAPLLDKFRAWIYEFQGRALSYGGLLATAFTYIHNQWRKLTVFLEDGRLKLDNNRAESHIRPIAVGRKVWLFAQSEAGARATASWYSLVETAKANGIEPYWYLKKIFEEMPVYLRDNLPVTDLLPWNIDAGSIKSPVVVQGG